MDKAQWLWMRASVALMAAAAAAMRNDGRGDTSAEDKPRVPKPLFPAP